MELGTGDAFLGAELLDCQTARLLAVNTIAPNFVELRVGASCHRVDSWNGTKRSASQAIKPGKDCYLGRLPCCGGSAGLLASPILGAITAARPKRTVPFPFRWGTERSSDRAGD
jgi:hypothetical protein